MVDDDDLVDDDFVDLSVFDEFDFELDLDEFDLSREPYDDDEFVVVLEDVLDSIFSGFTISI
jgi:hypothetical protein